MHRTHSFYFHCIIHAPLGILTYAVTPTLTALRTAGLRPTGKENARKPRSDGFCDFMTAGDATARLPGSAGKAVRGAGKTPGSRRGAASGTAKKRKVVRFSLEAAGARLPP